MAQCTVPVTYHPASGSCYEVEIELDDQHLEHLAAALDNSSEYSLAYQEQIRRLVSKAIMAKYGKLMRPYWSTKSFSFGEPVYPSPKTFAQNLCERLRLSRT